MIDAGRSMGKKAQGHCTIMRRNGWADISISEELRKDLCLTL